MQRAIHRLDPDALAALRDPRLDSIDESVIRIGFCLLAEPLQVDDARIITASRLEKDVPGFAIASKNATHGSAANAEHLGSRVVRGREPFAIGITDSSA
jgi:hypothetical protein